MIHISGCGKPGGVAEWTVKLVIISRWGDKLSTRGAVGGEVDGGSVCLPRAADSSGASGSAGKKGAGPSIGDVGTDIHLRRHGVCIHRRGSFVIQGQTWHGRGRKKGWY